MSSVCAIDIDLGRLTAVHSESGVAFHGKPWEDGTPLPVADLYLIEIAGPIMHHEESHSHRRWMLFNAVLAGLLVASLEEAGFKVLVGTSTAWTQGYSEIERDAIAGIRPTKYKTVTRKKGGKSVVTREPIWAEPHDVRECRAMIFFHSVNPKVWKPLDQYLKELVG
jgi:hypothetical protein